VEKKNGAAGGEKGMSKAEAVRQAVQKLGMKAKPKKLQEYILQTFNIKMGTDHISTAKGDIKRKKSKGRGKAAAAEQPAKAAAGNGNARVGLDDIETLHRLVKSVGAAHLRKLIDVMAK
jgi:hypothetical protein